MCRFRFRYEAPHTKGLFTLIDEEKDASLLRA